jgi:tight adherence protein G
MLFAMITPLLFGVFMFGSDGARAIQDKARLNEALEVASLAVSAQASSLATTRSTTAFNYIQYYFPLADISSADVSVTVTTCDPYSTVDVCSSTSEDRYYNYQVTGTITQDSWFPGNDAIVGFGEQYDVASSSASRKYQSEAIDVMLVADFSASMYEYWDGDSDRKFASVISILGDIADVLDEYNSTIGDDYDKSTIGVVGYDFYTKNDDGDFTANIECSKYYQYTSRGRSGGYWSLKDSPDGRCYSTYPGYPDYNTLDVTETINNVFETTDAIHSSGWSDSEVTNISTYTNVELTSDIDTFKTTINKTSNFNITASSGSGTSSYAGIIRGAQLLDKGSNVKKLLIVLSDGGDSYTSTDSDNFSDQLYGNSTYDGGLCSSIRTHFTESDIDITMAVIGFDYDMDDYPQLSNCVGEDNVYEAENSDEIEDTILSLITEEIGHLAD